jgi:mono/diheme cytochrome c family protein
MRNIRKYILTPQVNNIGRKILLAFAVMSAVLGTLQLAAAADDTQMKRGKYIVSIAGCGDCHTPGYLLGKPDISRSLGGSEVGFEIPGLGVFYGPNLTPDNETGLGKWTNDEIVTAFQAGKRPDGRELAPIMPWRNFASFTSEDAQAIAAYLKSMPPVINKVPGPFGPTEKPTSFVMKVVPPGN